MHIGWRVTYLIPARWFVCPRARSQRPGEWHYGGGGSINGARGSGGGGSDGGTSDVPDPSTADRRSEGTEPKAGEWPCDEEREEEEAGPELMGAGGIVCRHRREQEEGGVRRREGSGGGGEEATI